MIKLLDNLHTIGINPNKISYQSNRIDLQKCVINEGGVYLQNGALCINTGEFTGRSPLDKFIVDTPSTSDIEWGKVNQKLSIDNFENLYKDVKEFLTDKKLYIRDSFAGADKNNRLSVRFINTNATSSLFELNMFISPKYDELDSFKYDWMVIHAPEFRANPSTHGTRQHNFTVINFESKIILIGGSNYTGEIKKSVFTVMNYIYPKKNILPMHCSATIGNEGTALFFGLSGTGKTTLSADSSRKIIGDDEHGWSDTNIFNIEGGCYAKVINLNKAKEPQNWNAIKVGTLVENVINKNGIPDYTDTSITQNTRASYNITHLENIATPSIGGIPKNIFFLSCDAFGVLPPISKLSIEEAMYFFISGYTSKIAGTEMGIVTPQATFSSCFGEPFLPLNPQVYAKMLAEKIDYYDVNVWLVNTGWVGGPYGIGNRIELRITRALINAAINSHFKEFKQNTFGLIPIGEIGNIPSNIYDPLNSTDEYIYEKEKSKLIEMFKVNFERYKDSDIVDIF